MGQGHPVSPSNSMEKVTHLLRVSEQLLKQWQKGRSSLVGSLKTRSG